MSGKQVHDVAEWAGAFLSYLFIIGLARTMYVRCMYGNFGREITNYTVIYGACIGF